MFNNYRYIPNTLIYPRRYVLLGLVTIRSERVNERIIVSEFHVSEDDERGKTVKPVFHTLCDIFNVPHLDILRTQVELQLNLPYVWL